MRQLSPVDIISRAAGAVPEHARRTRQLRAAAAERAAARQAPLPLPMPASRGGSRGAARSRQPTRRRPAPALLLRRSVQGAAVLIAIAAPVWLWKAGYLDPIGEGIRRQIVAASLAIDFKVAEVLVEGRDRTTQKELRDALKVSRGSAIVEVDLAAVRSRLESLPWVRNAVIERRLPDTIFVRLIERQPIARLREKGRIALVDRDGSVMRIAADDSLAKLPLVAGSGAAEAAPLLVGLLAEQPGLARRVTHARRVGERRWDVHFDSGVVVKLPEEMPSAAWAGLAALEAKQRLLDRGLVAIDLRLKDRIGLQTPAVIEKTSKLPGRNA